ncbi:Dolichol-phosphate mannosyltransferase [Wickerhamomyces ciferrii]|uniref:Dolichol-phosphate mannosyltransferase subunit 1 n=1 Tax=Wickerhamomyces ciferrii (strain ATCC 14091 / BCRC 22168 / CBS 111 / JCM 3599 / NBRC 0793 / NRRL Y-1031 F-60-10) TaxID=1206466 RepID=K0KWD3_WICCF|nr:Dolichol-phosphate mannosyltransferase [Wickerhamomyces ciferrii]CCH45468.1 Dolichol-phosphate mannosyltransferase [Wickerhamomyces ciferrii]
MAIESTVVVPAYHEKLNIKPLTTRLFAALGPAESKKTELIFVDDNSNDGSVEEVEALQKQGYNVRIIVRTTERGLSSAVLRGFEEGKGEYLLCMDADLQHPPETVPEFLENLRKHPFSIGTRYAAGVGIDKDWPLYRRVISSGARILARPLTTASDPMSGFFGVQKKYLKQGGENINTQGFKIALELLAKLPLPKNEPIGEVPYSFGVRTEGESKLSSKVMIQYLDQLKELYIYNFGLGPILLFFLLIVIVGLYILSQLF